MSPSRAHALAPPALRAEIHRSPPLRHGFFGRRGGVSEGSFASLNAGLDSGDAPTAVAENRRRIADALEVHAEHLLSARQVHSADAIIVDEPWRGPRPQADGLVSSTPGLALSILTADCAPVLLADAAAGVIGAAHAGWRGALLGVTDATITAMERLGARRAAITAAVGPCISQTAYEVGPEFRDRFTSADPANADLFAPGAGDRLHFDLKGYVARRLAAAGLGRIEVLPACTFTEENAYFSHRRGARRTMPENGRNLSAIVLESGDA